eukprot:TRINITY_DN26183_c0_g1_i1.p1 TRINITY_DN26183_c0_g1~~TRINITY_DN26183_c0_g1_i1.p1  ORF type:complete len:349 (+),score=133.68 TRINITY_DN26183_c0_g1_i1:58-1104(+)
MGDSCRITGCGEDSADLCLGCNLNMCTEHLFQHDCAQEQAKQRQRVLACDIMLSRDSRGLRLVYWQRWGRLLSERRTQKELKELRAKVQRLEQESAGGRRGHRPAVRTAVAGTQTDPAPAAPPPALRDEETCAICGEDAVDECTTCGAQACMPHMFDHNCAERAAERSQRVRVLDAFASHCDRAKRMAAWQRLSRFAQERRSVREVSALRDRCRDLERRLAEAEERLAAGGEVPPAAELAAAAPKPRRAKKKKTAECSPEPRVCRSSLRLALPDCSEWSTSQQSPTASSERSPDSPTRSQPLHHDPSKVTVFHPKEPLYLTSSAQRASSPFPKPSPPHRQQLTPLCPL